MDHSVLPGAPDVAAVAITRVPLGREAGPGRGIHLPLILTLAPAENGRPEGKRAATDPRQPASTGCTSTRPPESSAGSSKRTTRLSSPEESQAAQARLSLIQASRPLRLPSRKANPSVVVSARLAPRISARASAIAQYGFRKRERPIIRPAP